MIIITIISVLITTSKCDSFQPLQDDKTCQDMTLSEYHQMNFNLCTGNEKGHCLMNEQSIPGFVCLQVEEIPKGKKTLECIKVKKKSLNTFVWRWNSCKLSILVIMPFV